MPFTKLLLSYFLTALVFFAVDMLWLGWLAKDFYNKQLSTLLSPEVNWTAAIIFYLIFIGGIMVFVSVPAFEKDSLVYAVGYGALFGIITYSTYDLTNLATLKNWPLKMVIVDIAWGAVLTSIVSTASYMILKQIN